MSEKCITNTFTLAAKKKHFFTKDILILKLKLSFRNNFTLLKLLTLPTQSFTLNSITNIIC